MGVDHCFCSCVASSSVGEYTATKMGNALSEEEENELLEEAYSMSLESPEADGYLNSGTAAPNCQPKHTKDAMKRDDKGIGGDNGRQMNHRSSSVSDAEDDRRRRQSSNQNASTKEDQRKLSYFQMARLGYQELVNAIIRPPRADYKVSRGANEVKLSPLKLQSALTTPNTKPLMAKPDGSSGASCIHLLWEEVHKN